MLRDVAAMIMINKKVATELNFPVTVFVENQNNNFLLRFFYSSREMPLCIHGTLSAPSQIVGDLIDKTPLSDEILGKYEIKNERIQIANYQSDLAIRKLKGCL